MKLSEYVKRFDENDRIMLLKDYQKLKKTGILGDSFLRTSTNQYCNMMGVNLDVFDMDMMAKELALLIAYEKYELV